MIPIRLPLAPLLALAMAVAAFSPSLARADEIDALDPKTCQVQTITAFQIIDETMTKVDYVEKSGGPTKSIPTAYVRDVRRSSTEPQAVSLARGMQDIERGNLTEALETLKALSGAGWVVDFEGKRSFKSFATGDPGGRGRRPPWTSEYAHFFHAKALALLGLERKDEAMLQEALLALDDQPVPGAGAKETSGGFLGRFKGGNSRWYPEALALQGRVLIGLGRHEDAARVLDRLYEEAVGNKLDPRWAYEAKIGAGAIAEARGQPEDAVTAYTRAADAMVTLLKDTMEECRRRDLGRWYSVARMRGASVLLAAAEKARSPAQYGRLRQYLEDSAPGALRTKFSTLPPAQLDALLVGAQDPMVQAVLMNGMGVSYLNEGKHDEALLALGTVGATHFQVPEEHARALWYFAQAADAAAKQAKGAAAKAYQEMAKAARTALKSEHPSSSWANR